jgi:hypothetical protein
VISNTSPAVLSEYFLNHDYPTTKLATRVFALEFGLDLDVRESQENDKSKLTNIDTANIETLISIYNSLPNHANSLESFDLLKRLSG